MGGHAYCHWAEALGVTDRGRRELQRVTGGPLGQMIARARRP